MLKRKLRQAADDIKFGIKKLIEPMDPIQLDERWLRQEQENQSTEVRDVSKYLKRLQNDYPN
jgi:hypothetical protein